MTLTRGQLADLAQALGEKVEEKVLDRETKSQPPGPVRRADAYSACGANGCEQPIKPGQRITRPPGRAWQHLDCSNPYKRRCDLGEYPLAVTRRPDDS